jgi:NADH-quinone oxidoreductase subunit N
MLLSLAGIPLTAGFIGKFYILAAGTSAGVWTLVLVLIVTSVIGLFYYLRIVVALYAPPEPALASAISPVQPISSVSLSARGILWILTALLIWFGVYPQQLMQLIRSAASRLG